MSDRNRNVPTDFGSESSAAAIAAAKQRRIPLGGVSMPLIPRLDQPPPEANTGVQNIPGAHRILSEKEKEKLTAMGQYHAGVGSAYAANQPALRHLPTNSDGEELPIDPRLEPRPAGSGLRPDTIKDLEGVAAANAKISSDPELQKAIKEIDEIDDVFETNEFGERVKSLLSNKDRAKAIEARCQPLSLEDLLIHGSVQQRVPIIPNKFEPVFRSPTGEENLEILRLLSTSRGSDEYLLDLLQLYRLTAGLYSINGKILTNHLNVEGDFDQLLFEKKYKVVKKMALPILADMAVNFGWFARRVQKLTVIDDIKSF